MSQFYGLINLPLRSLLQILCPVCSLEEALLLALLCAKFSEATSVGEPCVALENAIERRGLLSLLWRGEGVLSPILTPECVFLVLNI